MFGFRRQFPYLRPGVGMVLYRADTKEVALFERVNLPGVWQFPQGGLDTGESIEEAMWRELHEETGVTKDAVTRISEYPDWTIYTYPDEIRRTLPHTECLGQCHRWFFLELQPDAIVALDTTRHKEFSAWRFGTFSDLKKSSSPLKKAVYAELEEWFSKNLSV